MTLLHRAWRDYKNVGLAGLVASTLWFLRRNLWVTFHLLLERVAGVLFDRSDSNVWAFESIAVYGRGAAFWSAVSAMLPP